MWCVCGEGWWVGESVCGVCVGGENLCMYVGVRTCVCMGGKEDLLLQVKPSSQYAATIFVASVS